MHKGVGMYIKELNEKSHTTYVSLCINSFLLSLACEEAGKHNSKKFIGRLTEKRVQCKKMHAFS